MGAWQGGGRQAAMAADPDSGPVERPPARWSGRQPAIAADPDSGTVERPSDGDGSGGGGAAMAAAAAAAAAGASAGSWRQRRRRWSRGLPAAATPAAPAAGGRPLSGGRGVGGRGGVGGRRQPVAVAAAEEATANRQCVGARRLYDFRGGVRLVGWGVRACGAWEAVGGARGDAGAAVEGLGARVGGRTRSRRARVSRWGWRCGRG